MSTCEACWRECAELFEDADGNHVCEECWLDACGDDARRRLQDVVGGAWTELQGRRVAKFAALAMTIGGE